MSSPFRGSGGLGRPKRVIYLTTNPMSYPDEEDLRMHHGARARLFRFAQRNRRPMTPAEQRLWEAIRNRQLGDWKFRRQHPYGVYILDFYCHAARLCVEVDGEYHASPEQQAADVQRMAYLEAAGIRVLRFSNVQVTAHLEEVLDGIHRALIAGAL